MNEDALLKRLCESINRATERSQDPDGNLRVQLPLQYPNGEPITLTVLPDGRLTDDGATLLRLMRDDQLEAFRNWPEFPAFLRNHAIERDGRHLTIRPEDLDRLVFYLEGLRSMELLAPRSLGRSTAFDDQVRHAVRQQLDKEVQANRVKESVRELVLNPTLQTEVRREETAKPVTVSVEADFQSPDRRRFYVVLSYGGATHGERMAHLSAKLVNHVLMRTSDRSPRVETYAVVPKDGNYSIDELDAVALYTGHDPLPMDPKKDTKRFVRTVLETKAGPF